MAFCISMFLISSCICLQASPCTIRHKSASCLATVEAPYASTLPDYLSYGLSCSGPTVRCNTVGCAEGQTFIATSQVRNFRSYGLPCKSHGSQAAPLTALQTGAIVTPNAAEAPNASTHLGEHPVPQTPSSRGLRCCASAS